MDTDKDKEKGSRMEGRKGGGEWGERRGEREGEGRGGGSRKREIERNHSCKRRETRWMGEEAGSRMRRQDGAVHWRRSLATKTIEGTAEKAGSNHSAIVGFKEGGSED